MAAFLRGPLDAAGKRGLGGLASPLDRFALHGREVYWLSTPKQSETKLTLVKFERAVGLRGDDARHDVAAETRRETLRVTDAGTLPCPPFEFETVDVFTSQRFGGNPLAVFPEASGLTDPQMQQLATEFNLSETTFVLPPADPATFGARAHLQSQPRDALCRASDGGHGLRAGRAERRAPRALCSSKCRPVVVTVRLSYDGDAVQGAEIDAPQPLTTGVSSRPPTSPRVSGSPQSDVRVSAHPPLLATVGNTYVIAEVAPARLDDAVPDLAQFRRVLDATPGLSGRFSLYLYARTGAGTLGRADVRAARRHVRGSGHRQRRDAPGRAAALAHRPTSAAAFAIHQGVKMGRPSLLHASAWRAPDGIRASVGGTSVPVLSGVARL